MNRVHVEIPKGQPLRWDARKEGAWERTDVPEEIKQKYKFYDRDEKGNEFYIDKDYEPPLDVVCQIKYGMNFEELAQYILNKYEEKRKAGLI